MTEASLRSPLQYRMFKRQLAHLSRRYFNNLWWKLGANQLKFIFEPVLTSLKLFSVLHDITGTMFNRRFMEELFKPQELYSKKAMRSVFDRLAHASIMRLNNASMDKVCVFFLCTIPSVKFHFSIQSDIQC